MPPKKRTWAEANGGSGDSAAPAKLNRTSSDFSATDFTACAARTKDGDKAHNFKVSTWNVDGLRAWIKKGGLEFLEHEKPDVICLQETKCSDGKLPEEVKVK